MKTLARLLFLFCLPSIIWHTPLSAEVKISQTFSPYDDSIFSPWDLLNYENLSYDRIIDFLNEIEYGEGLEKVMTEQQMDQVIDFLAFLTRNGIPDWNTDAKEKLEQDIAWLQGKPNQSELADETSKCPSLWWSNFNGYQDFKTVPTVLQGNQVEILLCKGWVAEKWKQTKKFSRNHKKTLIIATVVVVAATVVIAATGGAGAGAVAAAGAVGVARTGSSSSDQEERPHVNKPGDVKFQDEYDLEKPSPEFEAPLLWNPSELAFCPSQKEHRGSVLNLGESHKPSNTDAMKGLIQGQSTFIKEDLSEQIPHEALNIIQKEVPSFWKAAAEKAKETGSMIAHGIYDFFAEQLSPIPETSGGFSEITETLSKKLQEASPFDIDPRESYRERVETIHEKIDETFGTDHAKMYSKEAKAAEVEITKGILPPPGSLVKGTPPNSTKGWKVGEPKNNLTQKGNIPKWDTVRARHWKNKEIAHREGRVKGKLEYEPTEDNLQRMKKGLAPQRKNPDTHKIESIELHHDPAQRDGGLFDFIEVTSEEHARLDACRKISGDNPSG